MADMIIEGGDAILGLGILSLPIQLAFFHWKRCGEYSCDRAAALYMKNSDAVVDVMLRLAGGTEGWADKIDAELYLKQADDYLELIGTSVWNRTLQYLALMNRTHPFLAVRAAEIKKWSESDQFKRIIDFAEGKQGDNCHFCREPQKGDWKFCRRCGQKR
jgi:Zn-dependent protease with chaperone function